MSNSLCEPIASYSLGMKQKLFFLGSLVSKTSNLIYQDEITVMDGSKCILQLRGVRPFLSNKYDITKHKNYKLLQEYDKRNAFDVEKYMARKDNPKLKANTRAFRM